MQIREPNTRPLFKHRYSVMAFKKYRYYRYPAVFRISWFKPIYTISRRFSAHLKYVYKPKALARNDANKHQSNIYKYMHTISY